jgi:TPR repeat protein
MGFDNPFPVFPPNGPQRSATAPIENGMRNMNINGRPSMDSTRPPTSASKTSGRSTTSMQSDKSSYSTDATSYDQSFSDPQGRLNGQAPFDPRGPPPRSITMPPDMGPPGPDRRPPTRQGGMQDGSVGPRAESRSGSSTGLRPEPGFGPPVRAQTFDVRPTGLPMHSRQKDSLDDYMPDFDAPSTLAMEDPLGIPLDSTPGIARSPTTTNQQGWDNFPQMDGPQLHRTRSQPDLRGQDDYGYGPDPNAPPVPRMPGGMAMIGNRVASPDPYGSRGMGPGGRPGMAPGPNQGQFHPGFPRQGAAESGWSDAGQRRGPGGPPGPGGPTGGPGAMRGPPPGRMPPPGLPSDNPDALPSHPTPVRPGLMQNGGPGPQQQRGPPGPPQTRGQQPAPGPVNQEPPVTLQELDRLRARAQEAPTDYASQLHLAKRLVEASTVLADAGGVADIKTRNKNREKFILEAHKVLKKLVQHAYPDAMFFLADCYGTGKLGLAVDHKEAFALYQQAAKLGHPASAYRTAVCCEIGGEGTRKDPLKAVQWYRRAATLGDVSAMYKLGMLLLKGLLGQQQSIGEAVIWLNRAAERADEENPHAVHELALLHEFPPRNGKIILDEKYALQLYQQASALGYRASQTRLGTAFEQGHLGCPVDDRASIHWYSKAAAQEDAEAELALSGWYLTGARGVLEANETEAYLWARKAALREYPKAEYAMGHFSEVGIGCPINMEDAKRWYGRAACKPTLLTFC